jgi:hypothetical protein
MASEERKFPWSKLRHRHRPSYHVVSLLRSKEPLQLGSGWRGKGRPQEVIGLGGGELHHNGTHRRSLLN